MNETCGACGGRGWWVNVPSGEMRACSRCDGPLARIAQLERQVEALARAVNDLDDWDNTCETCGKLIEGNGTTVVTRDWFGPGEDEVEHFCAEHAPEADACG